MAFEDVQTLQAENIQQEEIVADINKTPEINTATEIVVEAEITFPSTHNTEMNELVVNETPNITTERSAISNEQVEQVVVNTADIEIQTEVNETIQASHMKIFKNRLQNK